MKRLSSFLPLSICLGVFLILWLSAFPRFGGPGLTWDEAYYYPTFVDVAGWSGVLVGDPVLALGSEGIDVGWERIHELPPVVKWLGALSLLPAPDSGWGRLAALRVIPAAAFTLSLFLIYDVGRRWRGRLCGLVAVTFYILHPRLYAHGQIAATETVFIAVTLLALWIATHDLSRWKWRILLMLVGGLALATKVNGLILLAALGCWLLTRRAFTGRGLLPARSEAMTLVLLLFTPLIALSIWPWMWHSTVERIGEYIRFVTEHSHQGLWYFGRKWNFTGEPAPVSYPFVITHLTTPLLLLLCFWSGLGAVCFRAIRRRKLSATGLLLLLLTLAPLSAASLPGTPKYDGLRLFLPMFAPAALLAAGGLVMCLKRRRFFHPVLWAVPLAVALLQAVVLRPSLSYYNPVARAIGGTVFPFEQTYWGDALRAEAVAELNEVLPPGARVKTLAMQTETFAILRDWGVLRHDIVIDGPMPYDVHLLQNRRGFWVNTEWSIWQNRDPLAEWGRGSDDEALIYLFDGRPPLRTN